MNTYIKPLTHIPFSRKLFASSLLMMCLLTLAPMASWSQIDKKVSFTKDAMEIKAVLAQLEKIANLNFIYSNLGSELQKNINIAPTNTTAKNHLKRIEQQSNLQFTFNGNDVIVKLIKKEVAKREFYTFKGRVVDKENHPIALANITLLATGISTYSDISGGFNIPVYNQTATDITLRITAVGKKTLTDTILKKDIALQKTFVLEDLSLRLKEVEIIAQQKIEQSNSSILFNRETIENSQAFSLADILMGLPGKSLLAPQLENTQQLTLRSEANGSHMLTNSLGIGIIVDGLAISNDANMQNLNVGNRGMAGSIISSRTNGSFDVPFGGIDLREITADNIESIEVISGVAPAKYDDITDGAVIINRQAGKTDYRFVSRINANSSNFSLTKGFSLGPKAGALNISLNYLYSTVNPIDNMKSLNRVNVGLMWTTYISKKLKNTLSVDGNERLDHVKVDPDDGQKLKTVSTNRNFSVANRMSIQLKTGFFRKVDLNASFSHGYQNTYTEWFLNSGVVPVTYKDTTNAIYRGTFINMYYLASQQVIGEPISGRANLSTIGLANTGKIVHAISFGANFSYSDNLGEGIVADPERPRWANGDSGQGNRNDRPYDYRNLVPALVNFGFYANDKFKLKLFERTLSINAGVRFDVQNGYGTLQPRINTSYSLSQNLQLTMAYGIATKAPTLAHRYPAPTFFDIPLIRESGGDGVVDVRKSLYLVYTEKYIPDNSHLKPSISNQAELGLRYNKNDFSSSVFAYNKVNNDGFGTLTSYEQYILPKYQTSTDADGNISYFPTDDTFLLATLSKSVMDNSLHSKNTGIEWFISSPRIEAIRTKFNFTNSFSYSYYRNSGYRILPAEDQFMQLGGAAWYGKYPPLHYEAYALMSKIGSSTHIPKLGFVLSLNADFHWRRVYKEIGSQTLPIAWYDKFFNEHPISNFDDNNLDYGYLKLIDTKEAEAKQPLVYANLSMQLAKEINKKVRFSFNAYNLLNMRARYYNPLTGSVTNYNAPVTVGAELSIKF